MALIRTLAEVKAVLPKLVSSLSDESLLPNFSAAEIKYLVPVIGMGQYNELQAKYTANNLSDPEKELLKHVQLLVVVHAFRDEMILNHLMWTDQGLRTMTTQELGKPVGWEYKALKAFFVERSADAEEILLTYLWGNKESYPLWVAADQYKVFTSLLIRTGTDFKNNYPSIHQPMRTFYQLQPVVSEVQEKYLEEGIGRELVKYLVATVAPTASEQYIIALLKKALAYFTIKEACVQLPIRISDSGLTVAGDYTDKDTEDGGRPAATAAMIESLKTNSDGEGQNYLSKARSELYAYWLKNTASQAFNDAYSAGVMAGYKPRSERTSGNESRNFFVMG